MKHALKAKLRYILGSVSQMSLVNTFLNEKAYNNVLNDLNTLTKQNTLKIHNYPFYNTRGYFESSKQSNDYHTVNENFIIFEVTPNDKDLFTRLIPTPFNKKKFNGVVESITFIINPRHKHQLTTQYIESYSDFTDAVHYTMLEKDSSPSSIGKHILPRVSILTKINEDKLESIKPKFTKTEMGRMDTLIKALRESDGQLRSYIKDEEYIGVSEERILRTSTDYPISKNAIQNQVKELMDILSEVYSEVLGTAIDNDDSKLNDIKKELNFQLDEILKDENAEAYYKRLTLGLAEEKPLDSLLELYHLTELFSIISECTDLRGFNRAMYLTVLLDKIQSRKIKVYMRYLCETEEPDYIFQLLNSSIPIEHIISEEMIFFGLTREEIKKAETQ